MKIEDMNRETLSKATKEELIEMIMIMKDMVEILNQRNDSSDKIINLQKVMIDKQKGMIDRQKVIIDGFKKVIDK